MIKFDDSDSYRNHVTTKKNYKQMKKNLNNLDRMVRILVAVIISALYFTNILTGALGIVLLVLGGIFVLTSFVSFCPIYAMFGWSTCKTK